jgi:hypothetical protein
VSLFEIRDLSLFLLSSRISAQEAAMIRNRRSAIVLVGLVSVLIPAAAWAQDAAVPFSQLSKWVRLGDTVYVTDAGGREHTGKLVDLPDGSLRLDTGHGPRDMARADVRSVAIREHDSLQNGALIGLVAGIVAGGVLAASICNEDGCEGGGVVVGVALYGAMGAGIGAGIDALTPGRKVVVYRAQSGERGPTVSISPVLTPRRQGLAASVGF